MKRCPYCAEEIQDEAIKCRFCGEYLDENHRRKWFFKTHYVILGFLAVGPFVLPLVWFNPGYSRLKKIVITAIIVALTIPIVMSFTSLLKWYKSSLAPLQDLLGDVQY